MSWANNWLLPDRLPCGLNDHVVDLDEFFGIAGTVILVNRSMLEFVKPGDLFEP
jgi:hypothetical protein